MHQKIKNHGFIPSLIFVGNGCVEFDEFLDLVAPSLKDQQTMEKDLRDAFKVFDKNGN